MTWFSPQKLAIFDPIQPRLYGSKVQKWSRTIIPYVWEVFWCNRSLKWAELWSQQPWEWPKRLKSEEKWPQNGQFLSIGIFLWHRNYSHINIYWHPWFGPIFSTFGYLELSFAHNFFILLRMSWKEPAPLCNVTSQHLCTPVFCVCLKTGSCVGCATLQPEFFELFKAACPRFANCQPYQFCTDWCCLEIPCTI